MSVLVPNLTSHYMDELIRSKVFLKAQYLLTNTQPKQVDKTFCAFVTCKICKKLLFEDN